MGMIYQSMRYPANRFTYSFVPHFSHLSLRILILWGWKWRIRHQPIGTMNNMWVIWAIRRFLVMNLTMDYMVFIWPETSRFVRIVVHCLTSGWPESSRQWESYRDQNPLEYRFFSANSLVLCQSPSPRWNFKFVMIFGGFNMPGWLKVKWPHFLWYRHLVKWPIHIGVPQMWSGLHLWAHAMEPRPNIWSYLIAMITWTSHYLVKKGYRKMGLGAAC